MKRIFFACLMIGCTIKSNGQYIATQFVANSNNASIVKMKTDTLVIPFFEFGEKNKDKVRDIITKNWSFCPIKFYDRQEGKTITDQLIELNTLFKTSGYHFLIDFTIFPGKPDSKWIAGPNPWVKNGIMVLNQNTSDKHYYKDATFYFDPTYYYVKEAKNQNETLVENETDIKLLFLPLAIKAMQQYLIAVADGKLSMDDWKSKGFKSFNDQCISFYSAKAPEIKNKELLLYLSSGRLNSDKFGKEIKEQYPYKLTIIPWNELVNELSKDNDANADHNLLIMLIQDYKIFIYDPIDGSIYYGNYNSPDLEINPHAFKYVINAINGDYKINNGAGVYIK